LLAYPKFAAICAASDPNLCGEVAEWSIATVLKTVGGASPPGVRIPPSPPFLPKLINKKQNKMWALVPTRGADIFGQGLEN
jgi:hypothetical protein